MTDIILKIYKDTAGWPNADGDLQYTISGGDLRYYTIICNRSGQPNTAHFVIDDSCGQWQGKIGKFDTGTAWVWRAFSLDGTLIPGASGPIIDVDDYRGNTVTVTGRGCTQILRWRTILDKNYAADDAATILTDATNGLLQGSSKGHFPTATYGTWDLSTDVSTPTNNLTKGLLKVDGMYVLDWLYQAAAASYGGGGLSFDAHLYEADPGSTHDFDIRLYFKERESVSSGVNITPGMVHPHDLRLNTTSRLNVSHILFYGRFNQINPQPNDRDFWTENNFSQSGTSPTDYYPWTAEYTNNTISADAARKVGSHSIQCEVDAGYTSQNLGMYLDLTHTNAFDSDYFDSDIFVSGSGYKLDTAKTQYLGFWFRSDLDDSACNLYFGLKTSTMTAFKGILDLSAPSDARYGFEAADWTWFRFKLSDLISYDTGDYLEEIHFYDSNFNWDEGEFFKIDSLYFWEEGIARGEYASGSPTFRKDLVFHDTQIESDEDCEMLATGMYRSYNQNEYQGRVTLTGVHRNFALHAGHTVDVVYPTAGISQTTLPIHSIIYTPYRQTLNVGRHWNSGEIVDLIKRQQRQGINPKQ